MLWHYLCTYKFFNGEESACTSRIELLILSFFFFREFAKEQGCGFMTVDCTSHFTACALKKLGFELHYSLKYADYKVNGEVMLKPASPHVAVTVYTQRID